MAKKILAWSTVAGQFYREIGKRENGKSVRIYLGADEKQAGANVNRLEALTATVRRRRIHQQSASNRNPKTNFHEVVIGAQKGPTPLHKSARKMDPP